MSVEEEIGFPREAVSETGGAEAERLFHALWNDRLTEPDAIVGALYPHFPHSRIKSFRVQPQQGIPPVGSLPLDAASQTASYSGRYAEIAVTYGPDFSNKTWPTTLPKPAFRNGSELRFQIQGGGEFLTVPSAALKWDDDDDAIVPADVNAAILITRNVITIQWDFVDDPPIDQLDARMGAVNNAAFLGAEPETLLFDNYNVFESFKASFANSHTNRIAVTFLKRRIVGGSSIYGWNHDYREEPAGWAKLVLSDDQPRYRLATFNNIFL